MLVLVADLLITEGHVNAVVQSNRFPGFLLRLRLGDQEGRLNGTVHMCYMKKSVMKGATELAEMIFNNLHFMRGKYADTM